MSAHSPPVNAPVAANAADLTAHFAENYFAARERFRQLAADADWTADAYEIAATGPAGEPLFIDVAVRHGSGAAADRTVVVSSGLHGVEGFLGSAIQCAALERLNSSARGDAPRLVFVHALNPFGFAWIRRCNEDNVDLNRNFPAAGNSYRGAPEGYAKLDWLLNRKSPPSPWEPFRFLSLLAILRYGLPRLKRSIASGQYEFPLGLFYGGREPCETTRFVQSQFATWLGDGAGPIIHLDFHTGLGRAGEFQLLSDVEPSPAQAARLHTVLGQEVIAGTQSASVSYVARGSICEACVQAAGARDYNYVCVEFGTYPPVKVLTALRAENRAQHWDRPETETYRRAKDLLREAFCPRSPMWRQTAATQGLDLVERTITDWPRPSPGTDGPFPPA